MSDFRPGEIRMRGLGKRYWSRAGHAPSGDEFDDAEGDEEEDGGEGRRFRLFSRTPRNELWALRGVTCTVAPGERVAVIGANGAGKSTLIRILSRTLPPSEGSVEGCGIVMPFAALKSPLSRDASGCDNLRMLARLLRIPLDRLEERMADIVAFSELGPMANEKVARYSDRSFARLSMAMGLLIEPDICLIDDGVKAGDELFRRKFESRFEEMLERGTTLIHAGGSFGQLRRYCGRALLLRQGRLLTDEAIEPAIRRFLASQEPDDAALEEGADGAEALPVPPATPPVSDGEEPAMRLHPVRMWRQEADHAARSWNAILEKWRAAARAATGQERSAKIVQKTTDHARLVALSCLNSERRPVLRVLPGEPLLLECLVETLQPCVKVFPRYEIDAGPDLLICAEPNAALIAEEPGRYLIRAEVAALLFADMREDWSLIIRASLALDRPGAATEHASASRSCRLSGDKLARFGGLSASPAPPKEETEGAKVRRTILRPALAWSVWQVDPATDDVARVPDLAPPMERVS